MTTGRVPEGPTRTRRGWGWGSGVFRGGGWAPENIKGWTLVGEGWRLLDTTRLLL